MIKTVKRIIGKTLGRAAVGSITNLEILARDYGQYRTMKDWSCLDKDGKPIPWYTYPAIEYLNNFEIRNLNILEYGSGNSSLYFLGKDANVTSIEDDSSWYDKIKNENPKHEYLIAKEKTEYVERKEVNDADIVVIDGSHRLDCAKFVGNKITSGESQPSMIVFDNSDRHPKSIKYLDDTLGWPRADFCGFGPINAYTWVTSIFINPDKIIGRVPEHIASVKGTGDNAEC